MANILKGYLTLSILGLLLISVMSFIGSNTFLSEPKDNTKCLEIKKKYAFINCDLLDSVGEKELSDLIEQYTKKVSDIGESDIYLENSIETNKNIEERQMDNFKNINGENKNEELNKVIENGNNSQNDNNQKNKVLLNMKTIDDLNLKTFKESSYEVAVEEDMMNLTDFLNKMNSLNSN